MHIGFFSSIVIDGCPTSGYELANEAIVDGLRALGHTVSVIGFQLPRQKSADGVYPLAVTNLENAEASRLQKVHWLLKAHLTGLPVAAAKLTSFDKQSLSSIIRREGPFDAHIVNSWQIVSAFPELFDKPFGYISHNVEHITAAENYETASSIVMRYLYAREARLLSALEVRLCQQAAWVWALSKTDLENLPARSAGGSVLSLVTPRTGQKEGPAEKTVDIGMIGTWTWQANTQGLRWFIDEVMPLLPAGLTVKVAGSVPKDIVASAKMVEFLGRVESATDFLQSARVIALVSRGGTGVQLKTIEAFQAGHACVATSSSLRGVETMPENCRHADYPQRFATELLGLLEMSNTGSLPSVDGEAFAHRQHAALLDSLNKGLTVIAAERCIG